MPVPRTVMIDDDGSGTTGTIINNAWKQELYDQIDVAQGIWVPIAQSGVTFSAATGTWTVTAGNYVRFQYALVGRVAFFILMVNSSTLSASTGSLSLTVPGTVPPAIANAETSMPYFNAGVSGHGIVQVLGGATIQFIRDIAGTPWAADAGGFFLRAEWFYHIA